MTIIKNIDSKRFSFNKIEYYKNFTPVVVGNKIRILNTYDSSIELTSYPTLFNDFVVDGVTYSSVLSLQSALLPVLYTRDTLGGDSYFVPKYYIHNWTQTAESFYNPFSPDSANVNIRMESPGLDPYYYISAVFDEPTLISKILYACGSTDEPTNRNIKGFALLGSTSPVLNNAASGAYPLVLHDTDVSGHAEMQQNINLEDWFNLKEITLANPQLVRSISFYAKSTWSGTRAAIVKLLFK